MTFPAPTHTRRRRFGAAIGAVATIALLAGCSGSGASAPVELPTQNRSLWTLPLDSYTLTDASVKAFDYAENLLMKPCMEEAGFSWNVPYQDVEATPSTTRNAVGVRLFGPNIATEFGYHFDTQNTESARSWRAFVETPLPDAASPKLDACLDQVRESALPAFTGRMQSGSLMAADVTAVAQTSEAVRSSARAWKECMSGVGIPDLPESPAEMPSDWVADEFALTTSQLATTGEIAVASQDAACRESSGYAEALYAEEWERQVTMIQENADDLSRVREEIAAHDQRVRDAIAQNAPSAPAVTQ